jgi:hypothetical protein
VKKLIEGGVMLREITSPDNSGKSRYTGKKIIYLIICLALFNSQLLTQEKDSLIQIYLGLGDTLDRFDKDYFELLQNIEAFQYATFYIRNDKQLISKIYFARNNSFYDTTAIQTLAVLEAARFQIEQKLHANDTLDFKQREARISMKDGKVFSGYLDMFSKTNLYFSNAQELEIGTDSRLKLSIPVSELDNIVFIGESDVLYSTAMGSLAGAAFGGLLVLAASGDELAQGISVIAGGFFILIGGVSGLLIGLSNSEDDINIKITEQLDLLKLKDYAKYYFKYNESVEQNYKLVE